MNPKDIKNSALYQKLYYKETKDREQGWHVLENDIRMLSAEIVRLCSLKYTSNQNFSKIRSLESQIQYLEEMLAAYERDQKKME